MKNLGDLNDLLFKQMERLDEAKLSDKELEEEIKRSKAIEGISRNIIANANTILRAEQFKDEKWSADAELPKVLEVSKNEE